ncbi:hypothetical protein KGMB02408_08340 [Bacteroides faecalis]|uniref:Uncharacterized protein n=1 Tax=Bacteroides faecalis TaxID=2447885 RepID=A0A401LQX5_9BACE|nr:hypothetical protein KGMB02408_08340 [Bacteroides faecalis]
MVVIVFCAFRTESVVCGTIAVVDIRLLSVTAILGDISVDIFFIFLVEHINYWLQHSIQTEFRSFFQKTETKVTKKIVGSMREPDSF